MVVKVLRDYYFLWEVVLRWTSSNAKNDVVYLAIFERISEILQMFQHFHNKILLWFGQHSVKKWKIIFKFINIIRKRGKSLSNIINRTYCHMLTDCIPKRIWCCRFCVVALSLINRCLAPCVLSEIYYYHTGQYNAFFTGFKYCKLFYLDFGG